MENNYKIVIINLERSKNRKEKLEKQLLKYNINNYMFFPAVDGTTILDNLVELSEKHYRINENSVGPKYFKHFSNNEIACLRSHINAISYAQELNLDYVIILEDDVILCEDWNSRLNRCFKLIPKNWNHIFLSGEPDENVNKWHPLNFAPFLHIEKSINTMGAFSYILRNNLYETVKNALLSFESPTDNVIGDMINNNKLISYTFYPFLTYHDNDVKSEIWDKEYSHNHNSIRYFVNNC